MVFCGVFQTRDVNEVGTLKAVAVADNSRRCSTVARIELCVINSVVNDIYGIERHLEKAADVASGGFADGDDFVLPADEAANTSARIEHAAPIVFVRDVKRGQVVNRCNQSARMLPDHSAIARNMHHVQSETAGDGWKIDVMPKDVFYRRSKFFRDGNEAHVVTGEVEQFEVFFENEESELVLVRVRKKSFDQREDVLSDAGFAALNDGGGEADFHRPAFRSLNEGS